VPSAPSRATAGTAVACGTEPRELSIPVEAGARHAGGDQADRLVLVISF
jgi:hypothetical protein